ncbi:MAG: helix-turn-helix transcriptional regulator [Lachnospiraceae bacterium]|nr:helix-turn-helix transcriptional regulator [Lachnospiraceae bacterium]
MKDKTKLLKNIDLLSLVTQAPISLVSREGDTLYCPMMEEHHFLSKDMAASLLEAYEKKHLPEDAPFIHLFSLSVLQGVVRISEAEFLFVGPVCITHTSLEGSLAAFRDITTNEEAIRLHGVLEKFVPIDFFRFAGILAALSNNHNDTDFTPSDVINLNFMQNIKAKPFDLTGYATAQTVPIASIHFFLQTLYSIISSGNMDALVKHWQDNLMNTLINLHLHVEDMNFLFIPFFTYMMQGALKGGADIQVCFDTYVGQAQRFKQCRSFIECITELKRSSYEYCNLVRDSAVLDYLPDVCDLCISYINDHISEKITVDHLTHISGIHRNKLYDIFRANFDMTISEYIERERLRRAVVYLESSNYTISEIATTMGYSSQSHFITVFKKNFDCTPTEYRRQKK